MTKTELDKILKKHKKWLDKESDGVRANLSFADLKNINLRGANLGHADLNNADLSHADLRGANLSHAELIGVDFSLAKLRGANLGHADLIGVDFGLANLRGANLSHANLRGANLSNAFLREADLSHADLRGAKLSSAFLTDANLNGAKLSVLPLSKGDFNIHIDDKIAIQVLYHTIQNALYSKNTSQEIKDILCEEKLLELANRFCQYHKEFEPVRSDNLG